MGRMKGPLIRHCFLSRETAISDFYHFCDGVALVCRSVNRRVAGWADGVRITVIPQLIAEITAAEYLMLENEELQDPDLYGEFWEIVRIAAQEKQEGEEGRRALRNPSRRTLAAITYLLRHESRADRYEDPWEAWGDEPPF